MSSSSVSLYVELGMGEIYCNRCNRKLFEGYRADAITPSSEHLLSKGGVRAQVPDRSARKIWFRLRSCGKRRSRELLAHEVGTSTARWVEWREKLGVVVRFNILRHQT